MDNNRLIWFKGKIVPVHKASINILAPTSQFGANVFEGIRCYWNDEKKELYAFKLDEHLSRLLDSANALGFKHKFSLNNLKDSFLKIVKSNLYKEDIAVRQTLFVDGFGNWASKRPIEMFIAPIPKRREFNEKGVTTIISSWKRINEESLSPKIKCGANYMNSRMAQLDANQKNCDTAIMLNDKGFISEGTGFCLFIVKDNKLITPPLSASILDSITRKVIIELSKEIKIKVEEKNILPKEMYDADEIFFCGTSMEIVFVKEIDKKTINNSKEGIITKRIRNLYFDIVRGKNKKHLGWLTPIYK